MVMNSDEGLLVCIKCSRSLVGLNLLKMLLDSPDAPLEQACLAYKIGWLARRLGIATPPQPSPCINIWGPNLNRIRHDVPYDIFSLS